MQQYADIYLLQSHSTFFKITNTMSLVDYPLFSWVVVIHSLQVSSFLEAHHQEIILPVQSAFWYIVFAVALPVLLRVLLPTVGSRTRRRTGGLQQRLYTIPEADCTGKTIS